MDSNQELHSPIDTQKNLPLVLIHRQAPESNVSLFTSPLHHRVRFLDPDDKSDSSFLTLSGSVRLMLCMFNQLVDSETLDRYPSLECVVVTATGLDHMDLAECSRRSIRVTNAGDAFCDNVAEHAVGLLIDVLRRVSAADRFVRAIIPWPVKVEFPLGFKVSGKRVGVVGLGNIGMRIGKRLEAFGCSIAYNSRGRKSNVSHSYYADIHELVFNSEILFICCALAKETPHIINKDALTALGKNGVVINIGHGSLVDENELVQFLVRGETGGAGFDVFENEPYVPIELFGLDNVVLSPHRAAAVPESFVRLQQIVAGNIEAFFSNKPLLPEVVVG